MTFDPSCSSYDTIRNSVFKDTLSNYFDENCKGVRGCSIPINYEDLNSHCISEINRRAKFSIYDELKSKLAKLGSIDAITEFDRQIPEPELQILF